MRCPSRRPVTGRECRRFKICSSSAAEIQPSAAAQCTSERTAAILTLTVEGASGVSLSLSLLLWWGVRLVRWAW